MNTTRRYWYISISISFVFSVLLFSLWVSMNNYELSAPHLVNEAEAMEEINKYMSKPSYTYLSAADDKLRIIRVGIYLNSLQFFNSNDVNVSGYIWQKYTCDSLVEPPSESERAIYSDCESLTNPIPKTGESGFILPDQVTAGNDIEPKEMYRELSPNNDYLVIGWYFEATLRKPFIYHTYPFDHKTVWVRILPREFSKNTVLVPDYAAYTATGVNDIFGIRKSIVLNVWQREDTYFDYQFSDYDTNFGIENYIGKTNFPELRYNVVVKRKFGDAFIVYVLPLFLVAFLLFAAMLTVTGNESISDKVGFNTTSFIGASSALFFVLMLSHIQLREQFSGVGIVYIEYFYIIIYGLLVTTTANTYLFSIGSKVFGGVLLKEDNIIPKVCYWPLLLGLIILVTFTVV